MVMLHSLSLKLNLKFDICLDSVILLYLSLALS